MLFETGRQKADRILKEEKDKAIQKRARAMFEQDKYTAYNIVKELTNKWAVLTADSIPHHFERLIEENKKLKKELLLYRPEPSPRQKYLPDEPVYRIKI